MYFCTCEEYIKNFGQPSCLPSYREDSKLIFMPYRDNAGVINSIDSSDVLDATFFENKFKETPDKRWYMTPSLKASTNVRDEHFTQEIDGISYPIREGNRNYVGNIYGAPASPKFKGV